MTQTASPFHSGTPRSIPTEYQGIRFRSRLEARWAIFFGSLGWTWTFEPGTFQTAYGSYAPDFSVTMSDGQSVYWEVKPENTDPEKPDWRWGGLVREQRQPLFVTFGMWRDHPFPGQLPAKSRVARWDGSEVRWEPLAGLDPDNPFEGTDGHRRVVRRAYDSANNHRFSDGVDFTSANPFAA